MSLIRVIVRMPEPDCFLRYCISTAKWNFTQENPTHTYWRPAAAAKRGFQMVLFTEPSEHHCRRYMRSTECPSSWQFDINSTNKHRPSVSDWPLPSAVSVVCHLMSFVDTWPTITNRRHWRMLSGSTHVITVSVIMRPEQIPNGDDDI